MKCNVPRAWTNLPQRDKEVIERIKADEARRMANEELAETQEIWIKLSCIILGQKGATEEELLSYIVDWDRMYRRNERIETKDEQTAWINKELSKYFPTCGFPQFRIDELKRR